MQTNVFWQSHLQLKLGLWLQWDELYSSPVVYWQQHTQLRLQFLLMQLHECATICRCESNTLNKCCLHVFVKEIFESNVTHTFERAWLAQQHHHRPDEIWLVITKWLHWVVLYKARISVYRNEAVWYAGVSHVWVVEVSLPNLTKHEWPAKCDLIQLRVDP